MLCQALWVAILVGWSNSNILTTIRWIAMNLYTDNHGTQRMNPE